MPRSAKSRNWCFTLNNYTQQEVDDICACEHSYLFQKEIGAETKTPHLQGCMIFKNEITLVGVKRIIARAHWEIAKSIIASIRYCVKENTAIGEVFSNFDWQKYIGAGAGAALDLLKKDKKEKEIADKLDFQKRLDESLKENYIEFMNDLKDNSAFSSMNNYYDHMIKKGEEESKYHSVPIKHRPELSPQDCMCEFCFETFVRTP